MAVVVVVVVAVVVPLLRLAVRMAGGKVAG